MKLKSAACLLAALAGAAAGPQDREPPTYEVFRSGEPIQVDGRLEEAVWNAAPTFPFFDNRSGTPAASGTEARAVYDDRFLYFAFRIEDGNLWATLEARDQHLWTEEAVEVFLQADPTHPSYIELEVNPLGAMLDIFLIDVRKPLPYASWNSRDLQWAVRVDGTVDGEGGDRGWSCEIALPLEDVVTAPHHPPRDGDRWRANLYRIERKPAEGFVAWSPTLVPDFHRPDRFGVLVFRDRTLPVARPSRP